MAVDQTEAMIAAIKAQLEKERAAEAAKKKREEEEEILKNGGKKKEAETTKSQHKTLSKEELERIEAKRRRKREEALGIVREDEPDTPDEDEKKVEVQTEGDGQKPVNKEEKKKDGPAPKLSLNLGGVADDEQGGGLGGLGGGLGGLGGGLGSKPEGGLGGVDFLIGKYILPVVTANDGRLFQRQFNSIFYGRNLQRFPIGFLHRIP